VFPSMIDFAIFKKPKYSVAVIIPIYKSELTEYEKVSLDRCLHVLGAHPIIVIAPNALSVKTIHSLAANNIAVEQFDDSYFKDVDSYSKLLLRPDFYRKFIGYKYILIHQLDAFVFSDKLLDWCKSGFDYIGAPWINADWIKNHEWLEYFGSIKSNRQKNSSNNLRLVGNGGFSLRKVKSFLFASIFLKSKSINWTENEDMFWSFEVPKYLPFFKIPNEDVAVKFSFEINPRQCFEMNQQQLPFGCHAWEKHDIDFWRPLFKTKGYSI